MAAGRRLDHRVLVRLGEEGDRVARVGGLAPGRRGDPVEVRGQPVVAPAHEHVPDVAGDRLVGGGDRRPRVALGRGRLRLGAGQHLQPGLALPLEEQGQAVEVGVRTGPPGPRDVEQLIGEGHVVDQPQRGLVLRVGRVVPGGEEVPRQAQHVGEAGQHRHRHLAAVRLEGQQGLPEALDLVVGRPETGHVRPGELEGLLLVGGAHRRAHLRLELVAGVEGLLQRVLRLDLRGQGEERLRGGEGGIHLGGGDAVVDHLEEADVGGGGPQLGGDLRPAGPEVGQGDLPDLAVGGERAGCAHAGLAVELGQGAGHGVPREGGPHGSCRGSDLMQTCRPAPGKEGGADVTQRSPEDPGGRRCPRRPPGGRAARAGISTARAAVMGCPAPSRGRRS